MHLVYIDEVKCDHAQERYYWLCALAISEADIVSVEDSLNAIAQSYFGTTVLDSRTEFHAVHIAHGKGPFKGHNIAKRVALFKDLARVIDVHPNVGRVVVRLDPSKMTRDDHQAFAFMFLVERVNDLMLARGSMALLIADHDKEFVSTNVRNLSSFKATGTDFQFGREIRNVVDTVHHTHSHHSRLIQLTDLYTYAMSLREKEHSGYPRAQLVEYVNALSNFSFPSKYKYWPPE